MSKKSKSALWHRCGITIGTIASLRARRNGRSTVACGRRTRREPWDAARMGHARVTRRCRTAAARPLFVLGKQAPGDWRIVGCCLTYVAATLSNLLTLLRLSCRPVRRQGTGIGRSREDRGIARAAEITRSLRNTWGLVDHVVAHDGFQLFCPLRLALRRLNSFM